MTLPPPGGAHAASRDASASPARAPSGGGHVALVIVGSIVAVLATGLLAAGGVGLAVDQTQRDGQGFLM